MPKNRDRKPKSSMPSNAAVARYWRQGADNEAAWDKFHDAMLQLLEAGRMGVRRCEAIMANLEGEDAIEFVVDVESIAAAPVRTVIVEGKDGPKPALATARLFGITVSGADKDIDALAADGKRFNALAGSVKASGYSVQDANIYLLPVPISPLDLAMASPDDVCRLAQAGLSVCINADYGTDEAVDVLNGLKQASGSASADPGKPMVMANRVFIGVQMVVFDEYDLDNDDLREFDVLAQLRGEGREDADEEEVQLIDDAMETWRALMEKHVETGGIVAHPPVPWDAIRHALMLNHVNCTISVSLRLANKTCDPSEVEIDLSVDGPFLTITAHHGGEFLTQIPVARNLVFDGAEDFIEDLMAQYRVRAPGATPVKGPILH